MQRVCAIYCESHGEPTVKTPDREQGFAQARSIAAASAEAYARPALAIVWPLEPHLVIFAGLRERAAVALAGRGGARADEFLHQLAMAEALAREAQRVACSYPTSLDAPASAGVIATLSFAAGLAQDALAELGVLTTKQGLRKLRRMERRFRAVLETLRLARIEAESASFRARREEKRKRRVA